MESLAEWKNKLVVFQPSGIACRVQGMTGKSGVLENDIYSVEGFLTDSRHRGVGHVERSASFLKDLRRDKVEEQK